ncbi:hypothetical protein AMTR_s00013p00179490 [Amborella trichopoda]|uniref:Uncharacterized protein n=1 Tax=Amborella trichopoda TaxID=13333 RepID=W1PQD1_AMBTC|nr:hypothetical protein AMTR_s00013p00179490 [Amborella trichopoda]
MPDRLIFFNIAEFYMPKRMLQQFVLVQGISEDTPQWNRKDRFKPRGYDRHIMIVSYLMVRYKFQQSFARTSAPVSKIDRDDRTHALKAYDLLSRYIPPNIGKECDMEDKSKEEGGEDNVEEGGDGGGEDGLLCVHNVPYVV